MSIKSKIQALITAANTTTGESATDLTGAVQDLVDGYGQGGTPVINPLSVTENGTYTAPSGVDGYSPVTVNVPQGITPTGKITITENGTDIDVAQYALADVNVSGGGGSLPSSISKLDGGSFTPSADVAEYWISHNLGVEPKGVMVWATTRPPCTTNNCVSYFQMGLSQVVTGSTYIGYFYANKLWHDQPTSESSLTGTIQTSNKSRYIDGTTRFKWWQSTVFYEAGVTYKWLAWA